jgi:transcriptional regulator with XRE-family HTH domain
MVQAVVSNRLREIRQSLGWTIKSLSEASSVSVGTIHRLEDTGASPTLVVALYLAEALKCDVKELFIIRRVKKFATRSSEYQMSQAS